MVVCLNILLKCFNWFKVDLSGFTRFKVFLRNKSGLNPNLCCAYACVHKCARVNNVHACICMCAHFEGGPPNLELGLGGAPRPPI